MTMQPVSEIRQADQIPPADLWLGRLAHDLRGPIGPLQLAARMLEGSAPLPTQLNELGRTIERQTSLLLQVADELDDLLSISLGVFRLHLVRCDLAAIVE
ncbi:MAG TPA: histidine kinase dimerization/phospho-acceptor domain-containing protein, partial [Xanthomonadaceae bacterium]|nr:histidine kinase dimerization/phospho-acceptor domain-containing protein [Xanthomonadaceae bacterium]